MNSLIPTIARSLRLFRQDKWLIVLGLIPIIIGLVAYYYLGRWIYGDLLSMGQGYIRTKMESQSWLNVFTTLFVVVLTVAFYFLVSWTFFIVVSLLSCPFSDMMSSRVERLLVNGEKAKLGESISSSFGKVMFTIINELKKISFIVMISLIGLLLSLVVPPISFFISCALIAVSFIDYNWGRHDMGLRKCVSSYRSSFFAYTVAGAVFLVLISIPILNLFMLPFGVVYFSTLFARFELGVEREALN